MILSLIFALVALILMAVAAVWMMRSLAGRGRSRDSFRGDWF